MDYTTIQIDKHTRKELNQLKAYPRQTYDSLISSLLELVPNGDDEGEYTDKFRASMLQGLLDLKLNRTTSHEELKKKLGIN